MAFSGLGSRAMVDRVINDKAAILL